MIIFTIQGICSNQVLGINSFFAQAKTHQKEQESIQRKKKRNPLPLLIIVYRLWKPNVVFDLTYDDKHLKNCNIVKALFQKILQIVRILLVHHKKPALNYFFFLTLYILLIFIDGVNNPIFYFYSLLPVFSCL